MDITEEWLKNGIATVAITGYKGERGAEDREPIREHVVRLDYLRELLKTHSIVPNEPTEERLEKAIEAWFEYKLDDIDDYQLRMMKAHKVLIGVNDEPIEHSKPDGSLLKDLDDLVGYKEGEE